MTTDLLAELKSAAGSVDRIIAESTFPKAVKPAYLAEAMRAYPANGGKRLRPAIMLWSAAAAGGNMQDILPAAAGLEIFHNWTLVHDDIIDNDDARRGKPTAHIVLADFMPGNSKNNRKFGTDMAILAGDLMQGWAFELTDQSCVSAEVKLELAKQLRYFGYIKLISGEAIDVAMSYQTSLPNIGELFEMQSGKTGALLHYAARAGYMAGKNDPEAWNSPEAQALGNFGEYLALAFQVRDDYLGIFGNFEEFGKPIGSDLAEGKATLLLLHAMENLSADDKVQLQNLLYQEKYTPEMLEKARKLFTASGSVEFVCNTISSMTLKAKNELEKLPETPARELLSKLADYLINREK